MPPQRSLGRSIARWLAITVGAVVVVQLAIWVGVFIWVRSTNPGTPFSVIAEQTLTGTAVFYRCSLWDCAVKGIGGMDLRVWADEALLPNPPVALTVDEAGRVYVAEGGRFYGGAEDNRTQSFWLADDIASQTVEDRDAYIQKWIDAGNLEPSLFTDHQDRLSVFEDSDQDGRADTRAELASFGERLDGILAGVLVRDGEAWLTNIPSVYHLGDSDGDGIPDSPRVLSTGYGVKTALQGHDLHGLAWGPDGRIYFSVGDRGYHVRLPDGRVLAPPLGPGRGAVFRMKPDGSELEVFASGLRNPQELAFDDAGNLFTGENNSDGGDLARVVYVVEGGDSGWAMAYQDLAGDYLRGPWIQERHWELHHEGQPAWIVPPIAHLANGPAGFAHYPGLGLPERYDDHFFLADYRYQAGVSRVWSFATEPEGAGFRVTDPHDFIGNVLATDVAFSFDGRLFVSTFGALDGGQQLLVAEHQDASSDPRIVETARLARKGVGRLPEPELTRLLDHPDQRIRLRAQFTLAERGKAAPLAAVLRAEGRSVRARTHALWGLGQLGPEALRAGVGEDIAWAAGEPPALREQIVRIAGEGGGEWLAADLVAALRDPSLRIRFFAAQSLGRLGAVDAVDPLFAMLRENDDRDPFLRHAGVFALHRIGDVDAALARADDPSRAVRLAVLLQLRRSGRGEIARFLADSDPFLMVEAARAIHDVPIPDALPALAALAESRRLPTDDDPQSSYALHRRVIGANRTLGSEEAALRLAAYVLRDEVPLAMRKLALETLAEYTRPAPRDLAMTWHRPLAARDEAVVHAALDRYGVELVAGDLGDRALEIASAYGRVPLPNDELLALVENSREPSRRIAGLTALAGRDARELDAAIAVALASDSARLRAEARRVLAGHDPEAALASILKIPSDAPIDERQAGWRSLTQIGGDAAAAHVAAALDRWEAGDLDRAIGLEVLEAARALEGSALDERVAAIDAAHERDPVGSRAYVLAGGDAARGRLVFQTRGDCQRCHGSGGSGSGVGPDLAGITGRRSALHVLESILDPQAEIASGFATVSIVLDDGRVLSGNLARESESELVVQIGGEGGNEISIPTSEIRERSPASSGMPPMGLALSPRELRDLVAYVATL
jgi:quinoprotein glucose dehydrogenase